LVMLVVLIGVFELIQVMLQIMHLWVHLVTFTFLQIKFIWFFYLRFYSNKSIIRNCCFCILCYCGNFTSRWFMSKIYGFIIFCIFYVNVYHRFIKIKDLSFFLR
jgi:hypothetical protein